MRRAGLRSAISAAMNRQAVARPDDQASDLAALSSGLRELHDPMHILLAEDNVVNQRVILRILEKAGHSAVAGAQWNRSGREVLRGKVRPCADGRADASNERLRGDCENPRNQGVYRTPIMALTAHAMSGDRERCFDAGMDDYLTKPIRASTLIATIQKYKAARGVGARAASC